MMTGGVVEDRHGSQSPIRSRAGAVLTSGPGSNTRPMRRLGSRGPPRAGSQTFRQFAGRSVDDADQRDSWPLALEPRVKGRQHRDQGTASPDEFLGGTGYPRRSSCE